MFLFLLWFAVLWCAYLFCVCSLRFWYSSASDNKHTHLFSNNTNIWQVRGAPCTFIELYEIEQSLSCIQCNELKQRNRFKLKNTFNFFWNAQLRNYRSKSRAILQKRKKMKKKKKTTFQSHPATNMQFWSSIARRASICSWLYEEKMHPMQKEQTVFSRKKSRKFAFYSIWNRYEWKLLNVARTNAQTYTCTDINSHSRAHISIHTLLYSRTRSHIHTRVHIFTIKSDVHSLVWWMD